MTVCIYVLQIVSSIIDNCASTVSNCNKVIGFILDFHYDLAN
jgi:hypothetical protein